jgi:hypothetical protein
MNFGAFTGVLESIETVGQQGQIQKLNIRIPQGTWDPEQGKNVEGSALVQATHYLGKEGKRGSCANLVGSAVIVNVRFKGREYNGKSYTDLEAVNINGIVPPHKEPPMPASTTAPTAAATKKMDDSLPF